MREFFRDLGRLIKQHTPFLLIFLGIIAVLIVMVAVGTHFRMSDADFCTTCHYMEPYYRHWQASSHADVTCVQCHDYGVGSLALSTIRYWTNTYTTRPKSNVPDEACLQCHETSSLSALREYRKGIMFDHQAHLSKPLRGEDLRCTSCHNQIVQFDEEVTPTHMTVNDRSCFVCHFKDAGQGEAVTGCDACHGMPKTIVEHGGFTFDHEPYLKAGVDCKQCHTQIVKGDGAVPEGKCYACHVERSRKDHSREELHQVHVTTNGIDCFQCHSDIKHGNFEMVSSLEIQCENCHVRMHNAPKQLYMGIGGADTLDIPSPHFLAQVSCDGCHTHLTPQGEPLAHQAKKEAQRASCVTCHGQSRQPMFDNWLEGSRKLAAELPGYLSSLRSSARGVAGSNPDVKDAITGAEKSINLVSEGHIAHNIWYSLHLLADSRERVQSAVRQVQAGYTAPALPASAQREHSCVTFCHGKGLLETVSYSGKSLPHTMHITDLEQGCGNCHSMSEHGKTAINKEACASCHESM
ncbi:MAG: hypothetical protein NDJ18_05460 [candidate division Zixibacteria bacterium]|nr:hypothetical protein [candidate division Zixibacteria bacterium]